MRALLVVLAVVAGCDGRPGDPSPPSLPPDQQALLSPWADRRYEPVTATATFVYEPLVREFEVGSNVPGIAPRPVVVILPPGYFEPENQARRYPVLYMGDGQNVLNNDAFSHGGWQIQKTVAALAGPEAEPVIVVAPHHGGAQRRAEYTRKHQAVDGGATPEHYLDWLQYNVMPWVDSEFRTVMDASRRGIGGSSSAAILALYAGWTRSTVYRRVIAMSTFYWDTEQLVPDLILTPAVRPTLKIYMDCGTPTDGCDDLGQLSGALLLRGFVEDRDLKLVRATDHQHNEEYWRERFPGAYRWMYPP